METIVFLDRSSIPTHIHFRPPNIQHQWVNYPATHVDEIIQNAQKATVVITNKVPLNRQVLEQLPSLQHIAVIATGYNIVDIDACKALGIAVTNIRSYATTSVPEHTIALIFALRRHLMAYRDHLQRGEWQQSPYFHHYLQPTLELNNSQLGIIGGGELGQATAKLASALGMQIVFADRKGEPPSLRPGYQAFEQVLRNSDVVALFCPLTDSTHHLISLADMRQMKSTALLINTSRGGLVNEADLATALNEQLIAGAGFDVASQEPINNDNPLLQLLDKPNFLLTPHVAWTSDQAMQTQANILIDNIEAFFRGEPQNRVI